MSVGLTALLSTPIRIKNIRAGRASPELKAQHLTGQTLVMDLSGGKLEGGEFGSVDVSFVPPRYQGFWCSLPPSPGVPTLCFVLPEHGQPQPQGWNKRTDGSSDG